MWRIYGIAAHNSARRGTSTPPLLCRRPAPPEPADVRDGGVRGLGRQRRAGREPVGGRRVHPGGQLLERSESLQARRRVAARIPVGPRRSGRGGGTLAMLPVRFALHGPYRSRARGSAQPPTDHPLPTGADQSPPVAWCSRARGAPPWLPSPPRRAVSSAGRAPALQAGSRRFEPVTAHSQRARKRACLSSAHAALASSGERREQVTRSSGPCARVSLRPSKRACRGERSPRMAVGVVPRVPGGSRHPVPARPMDEDAVGGPAARGARLAGAAVTDMQGVPG
jgi:hypothetical protein